MKHTISLDPEEKIVTMTVDGEWTVEDATVLDQELTKLLPQAAAHQLAVDLEKANQFGGTAARRLTAEVLRKHGITQVMFNAHPAVRIMGKILLTLSGDSMTGRFFATRAEAMAWLRKERQGK